MTTLNKLQAGQLFKLNTKQFYLRLHIYKVIENINGVVKYALSGNDSYNQITTLSGNLIKVLPQ